MVLDVDQEHVCSDRFEEQIRRLEAELDGERTLQGRLDEDLRWALDMCNTWADHEIELHQDINMLRAHIEPLLPLSSDSDMDISEGSSSDSGRSGGALDSGQAPSWQVSESVMIFASFSPFLSFSF